MAVTQEFMNAVQSGKVMRVRIMLKDSLLVDPTAAQFDEMISYAEDQLGDIYVKHDGEDLSFDVTTWDEDYLNEQMVAVVNNFSDERVDLLKGMVRYIYSEKASKIRTEKKYEHTSAVITRKHVGTGMTIAGAALAVAGICTSHAVMTIGGVAVTTVGVALIASDKGE